jgi:hypothetical protein
MRYIYKNLACGHWIPELFKGMRRETELTVWGSGGLTAFPGLGFNPVVGLDVHGALEDLAEDSHPRVVVERYHG